MRNRKKDTISESSDINSDNETEPLKMSGKKIGKPRGAYLGLAEQLSESDSFSELEGDNKAFVTNNSNKSSPEKCSSKEIGKKSDIELSEKDVNIDNSDSVNSIFSCQDITSDDEIYMFQCPATYKKQDLLNKVIDFNKTKQTINNENEIYQLELVNFEKKFITLALPKKSSSDSGALIKLPIKGQIIIDKAVEAVDNYKTEDSHDQTEVVFPHDIKIRHPLLGIDWEGHIKEANKAIKRKNSLKKSKRRKILETNANEEIIENGKVELHVPTKKKKKKE